MQLPVSIELANRPTHLKLKTRRYVEKDVSEAEEDENDENTCSICFGKIEYGERVGELSCNHVFHVDCLKGWLSRRNVCPLCLQPNIATPEFASDQDDANAGVP